MLPKIDRERERERKKKERKKERKKVEIYVVRSRGVVGRAGSSGASCTKLFLPHLHETLRLR